MNQVKLAIEQRSAKEKGKGAAGRIRKQGRVPGVLYGFEVDPTAVSVDALELYHALHTRAGTNVLLVVEVEGDDKLCVARDIQRHPVKGDVTHFDLLSVDKNATIVVEIPISVDGNVEGAVVNQVLGAVPIHVAPLKTPNSFSISVDGLSIGDTLRVEELTDQLPEGASFDIDLERTVVTINPPETIETEDDGDSALDEFAGEGGDAPAEAADEAAGDDAGDAEGGDEG